MFNLNKKKQFLGYAVIDQFGNLLKCADPQELAFVIDKMATAGHSFKVYACILSVVDGKVVRSV